MTNPTKEPPNRPVPNFGNARTRMVSEENLSPDRPHTVPPRQTMGIALPPIKPIPAAGVAGQSADAHALELAQTTLAQRDAAIIARDAELARVKAELEDAKRLPLAPPLPTKVASSPPSRGDFLKAGYKFMGALTLFLGVVSTYLGGRALTKEAKVDSVAAASSAEQKKALTVQEQVKDLQKYALALAKYSDCVNAQRDSAIERGTGHVIESDHADVNWVEQSLPVAKPRTVWKNAPWLIPKDESCPSRPAPPRVAP